MLCYEYPEACVTFEAWTSKDGHAFRLAAVSDLNSLAGSATGGASLLAYNGAQYIAFWTSNGAPNPPGAEIRFDCSLWSIRDGVLVNPIRIGVTYQQEEHITQVISCNGIGNRRELTVDVCKAEGEPGWLRFCRIEWPAIFKLKNVPARGERR